MRVIKRERLSILHLLMLRWYAAVPVVYRRTDIVSNYLDYKQITSADGNLPGYARRVSSGTQDQDRPFRDTVGIKSIEQCMCNAVRLHSKLPLQAHTN